MIVILTRYKINGRSTKSFKIFPYPSSPACIVLEHQRKNMFLAQNLDGLQHATQVRQDQSITGELSACITGRNTLICIFESSAFKKARLVEYSLRAAESQRNRINMQPFPIGHVNVGQSKNLIVPQALDPTKTRVIHYIWKDHDITAFMYTYNHSYVGA